MSCDYIGEDGVRCGGRLVEGSSYCSNPNHYSSKGEYEVVLKNVLDKFVGERERCEDYELVEIEGDGACLYRCFANAIFLNCGRDLNKLVKKFKRTGYFDDKCFLGDYIDISDCFMAEDYRLDVDLEGDIARGLQRMILNYVKKNSGRKVMFDMTLEELIKMCHDISLEDYLKNYEYFAGDDDYVGNKRVKIGDRWGGTPEIKVFSLLFNMDVIVYTTQKFDEKILCVENTGSYGDGIYLRVLEEIGVEGRSRGVLRLLMRYYRRGSHYDFLGIKK